MNPIVPLLLITALSIPTTTLVLRSGDRISVDGSVRIEDRVVLFRSGGALYSVPADEVDFEAARAAEQPIPVAEEPAPARARLKVTAEERARLLRDLEQNHSGTAAPASALLIPSGPTATERQLASQDEWAWRRDARGHEEGVRRAQEEVDLLRNRAEQLRSHIVSLLSLGYKPNQFTYDSTQLAYTLEQIPRAELEVQRAQRAWDQFRDDARRQNVMPGWLR